jgi:hypothetical protein
MSWIFQRNISPNETLQHLPDKNIGNLFRLKSRISTFWLKNLVGFVVDGVKVVLRFEAAVRGIKTTGSTDKSLKAAGRSHQLSNGSESIKFKTWPTTIYIPQ